MAIIGTVEPVVSHDLVEAIATFPVRREIRHCDSSFTVSPFAIYATCPVCKTRIKVRSLSGATELEDVFDAVFEWMNQPGAEAAARERMREIAADAE